MEQGLPAKRQSILKTDNGNSRRVLLDQATRYSVRFGGGLVFFALLLIFFYLLYVVKPIFDPATITPQTSITYAPTTTALPALLVGSDEHQQVLFRVDLQGKIDFYSVATGQLIKQYQPQFAAGVNVVSATKSAMHPRRYALRLSDDSVQLIEIQFKISYPNDQRLVTPSIRYPLGETPRLLTQQLTQQFTPAYQGQDIHSVFAFAHEPLQSTFVAEVYDRQSQQQQWQVIRFIGEENLFTEEINWTQISSQLPSFSGASIAERVQASKLDQVLISPDQRQLFLRVDQTLLQFDITDASQPSLKQQLDLSLSQQQSEAETQDKKELKERVTVIDMQLLAGANSLMIHYSNGNVAQYFQVMTQEQGRQYQFIRYFKQSLEQGVEQSQPALMAMELFRKSFITLSANGELSLFYTTSERELYRGKQPLLDAENIALSPRGNGLIVDAKQQLHLLNIRNEHPEISWHSLWQKVWYEGYPEPQYVWQSTSGTDDFEAKLSLMPLAFGTMKAAFYAMLFAIPIAVAGAIYTAYFMSSKVRAIVKPTVEVMEALPTVILGFLAGLWLAPFVEHHLPGMLMLLLLLPLSVLATAMAWLKLPVDLKQKLPETYKELLLIPVLCLVAWGSFELSPWLEQQLFAGDTRVYLKEQWGLSFDQRNAIVVGIAMGFAVIPTIFSIAEDAVFSVPRHLSNGALALGATQWQTLMRVVLLTASPGIFSAIMMGMGRAVGETMIVLMATGNTPIMDMNIFNGMRTLAANIAVEMPESSIGSSHYRVLFLAAFVLFIFTFVFNTLAEIVRQRLRERYSSL